MFDDLIVAYLFLGGAGGGACFVLGILGLMADGDNVKRALLARFRNGSGRLYGRFFCASLVSALGVLLVGALCLLADAGRPDRILLLLAAPPSSYLVVGSWALLACSGLALWITLVWCGAVSMRFIQFKALHVLLAIAGFATALYTGLFLASMSSVPLWDSLWLAVMLALSGLSCGLALTLLTVLASGASYAFSRVIRRLVCIDTLVIAMETCAVILWLASVWPSVLVAGEKVAATDVAAIASVKSLCVGEWAPLFWLGVAVVGLAIPAFLEIAVAKKLLWNCSRPFSDCAPVFAVASSQNLVAGAAYCVLAGGACLRYLVVFAAVSPAASFPL